VADLIVVRCGCRQTYTQAQWDQLPLVGYQDAPADWSDCDCRVRKNKRGSHSTTCAGHAYRLELRNCLAVHRGYPCGTTLTREVARGERLPPKPG